MGIHCLVGLPGTFLVAGLAGVACCLICLISPLRTLNAKVPSEAEERAQIVPLEIASA